MPRKPEPDHDDNQESLIPTPPPMAPGGGPVYSAATRSVDAARSTEMHEAVDEVLGEAIKASAAALDRAGSIRNSPYAVGQLVGPFRELLEAANMTPSVRETKINQELSDALDSLARPADGSAQEHHAEDSGN